MKKFMILATAAVAAVGCTKTNVEPNVPAYSNEIQLTSSVLTSGETKAMNIATTFVATSEIYMWSYDLAEFKALATTSKDPKQTALKYKYGATAWTPVTTYLEWQDDKPTEGAGLGDKALVLVGIHPTEGTDPSVSAKNTVGYTIKAAQNDAEAIRLSDVMWAAHTGTTIVEGDAPSSTPENLVPGASAPTYGPGINKGNTNNTIVPLEFHHLTSALDFKIRFTENTPGSTVACTEVKVNSIKLIGTEVATAGSIALWNGVLTPDAAAAPAEEKTISWTPATPTAVTTAIKKEKDNVLADADYMEMATLLTIPGNYTSATKLVFSIEYKYNNGTTIKEIKDELYTFPLGSELAFQKFERNKINRLKVHIQLNSNQINITSSIVDWTENDITPEVTPK